MNAHMVVSIMMQSCHTPPFSSNSSSMEDTKRERTSLGMIPETYVCKADNKGQKREGTLGKVWWFIRQGSPRAPPASLLALSPIRFLRNEHQLCCRTLASHLKHYHLRMLPGCIAAFRHPGYDHTWGHFEFLPWTTLSDDMMTTLH